MPRGLWSFLSAGRFGPLEMTLATRLEIVLADWAPCAVAIRSVIDGDLADFDLPIDDDACDPDFPIVEAGGTVVELLCRRKAGVLVLVVPDD